MKVTRITLLALIVSVLVLGFGIVSLIGADAPGAKKTPGEEQRILTGITFTDFMHWLPEEKRIQVEMVLEENLACPENGDEEFVPDHNRWIKNVYLGLQSVLTPEELEVFDELLQGNRQGDRLSTTAALCQKCGEARDDLDEAYEYLDTALSEYDPSYCDFGIGPDSVYIYISLARYYADQAREHALNAYFCDCNEAIEALYDARKARKYRFTAYKNTLYDCGSSAPWVPYLVSAKGYIDSAIYKLENSCYREACL
jgi:hypothetical protein